MTVARLAALRMRRSPGWYETVSAAMGRLGCSTCRHGWAMDVWRQDWQRALPGGGYAVDGWRLRTLWLGPKRHALGVLPQRIYLRTDGGRDERPEREIVNVRRQRQRPLQERLRGLTWFLRRLQECCGKQFGDPVSLVASDPDPLNGVTLLGSRATFSAISEFPKWRKYLISLSFLDKASVRRVQVGGFEANIVVHRSTAVRGRGGPPPPWESSCRTRTGPVEADGTVDAQNAPTAPWKTRGGPRNSDSLLRWDPDQGEGVWNATEATELSC